MERRTSARLARKSGAAPYSRSGSGAGRVRGGADGSTGLTQYMGSAKIESAPAAKGKKKEKEKLPPNWKKAKDKEGKVYYFNTVTQQRSHEVPPALPPGWREALHEDSGRVYYYHKETRKSTFEFPTAEEGDDEEEEDDDYAELEAPAAPEGFFARTMSSFRRGKKKEGGPARSNTFSRTLTLSKKKKEEDKAKAGKAEGSKGKEDKGKEGQKTVFISCSTLIKEVKLCVGADQQVLTYRLSYFLNLLT